MGLNYSKECDFFGVYFTQNTQNWLLKQSLTNRMRFKKMCVPQKQILIACEKALWDALVVGPARAPRRACSQAKILNGFPAQRGSLFDTVNSKQCLQIHAVRMERLKNDLEYESSAVKKVSFVKKVFTECLVVCKFLN